MKSLYTISELARELDLTARAIRLYEDRGLIHPRREGNSRVYDPDDRSRLEQIVRGKRLGLTLREIRRWMSLYQEPQDRAAAITTLRSVEQYQKQLQLQERDLRHTLAELEELAQRYRTVIADAGQP